MVQQFVLLNEAELDKKLEKQTQELIRLLGSNQSKRTEWICSKEVPTYLGVSAKTWQNYRDKKLIPFSQIGRKIWVKKSDLDDFIETGMIGKHGRASKH